MPARITPGLLTLSGATAINRALELVEALARLNAPAPLNVSWASGTPVIRFAGDDWIPFKATAFDSGSGSYTWVSQAFGDDGERVDADPGLSGGPDYAPLKEANGIEVTDLPFYGYCRRRIETADSGPVYEFSAGWSSGEASGGRVYGQANSLPTLPGDGPRQTLNFSPDAPTSGLQLCAVSLTDDPGNDRLSWLLDNQGLYFRAYPGSTLGPRRRLNVIAGGGVSATLEDAEEDDEVVLTLEASAASVGIKVTDNAGSYDGEYRRNVRFIDGDLIEIATADDAGDGEYEVTVASQGLRFRLNSAGDTYTRRRLNLIETSGIAISIDDDAANDEVDVTFELDLPPAFVAPDRLTKSDDDYVVLGYGLHDDPDDVIRWRTDPEVVTQTVRTDLYLGVAAVHDGTLGFFNDAGALTTINAASTVTDYTLTLPRQMPQPPAEGWSALRQFLMVDTIDTDNALLTADWYSLVCSPLAYSGQSATTYPIYSWRHLAFASDLFKTRIDNNPGYNAPFIDLNHGGSYKVLWSNTGTARPEWTGAPVIEGPVTIRTNLLVNSTRYGENGYFPVQVHSARAADGGSYRDAFRIAVSNNDDISKTTIRFCEDFNTAEPALSLGEIVADATIWARDWLNLFSSDPADEYYIGVYALGEIGGDDTPYFTSAKDGAGQIYATLDPVNMRFGLHGSSPKFSVFDSDTWKDGVSVDDGPVWFTGGIRTGPRTQWVSPPATADATGYQMQLAVASGYLYVCVGLDEWERVAISTW